MRGPIKARIIPNRKEGLCDCMHRTSVAAEQDGGFFPEGRAKGTKSGGEEAKKFARRSNRKNGRRSLMQRRANELASQRWGRVTAQSRNQWNGWAAASRWTFTVTCITGSAPISMQYSLDLCYVRYRSWGPVLHDRLRGVSFPGFTHLTSPDSGLQSTLQQVIIKSSLLLLLISKQAIKDMYVDWLRLCSTY